MAQLNVTRKSINKAESKIRSACKQNYKNDIKFCFNVLPELDGSIKEQHSLMITKLNTGICKEMILCCTTYCANYESKNPYLGLCISIPSNIQESLNLSPTSLYNHLVNRSLTTDETPFHTDNLTLSGPVFCKSPFKEVDDMRRRFMEKMKECDLLQDEEEEDFGEMAENAGIEW